MYRPITSEHIQLRNVKFTIDDKYVITDIRVDAKFFYLEWQDELNAFLTQEEMHYKMFEFRIKMMKKLDELKYELKAMKITK